MAGFLKGFKKEWNTILVRTDKTQDKIDELATKIEDLDD